MDRGQQKFFFFFYESSKFFIYTVNLQKYEQQELGCLHAFLYALFLLQASAQVTFIWNVPEETIC